MKPPVFSNDLVVLTLKMGYGIRVYVSCVKPVVRHLRL